jgi:protein-S-isoprenylcysteine O-methyltransferase Ste14
VDIVRVGIKLLGLVATLGPLFSAYWLFPEYARDFYNPVWEIVCWTAFPVGVLTVACFFWTDRRMIEPRDAYWAVGLSVLGRWDEVDGSLIKQHALAWIVKGFFLPLMLAGAAENIPAFSRGGLVLNDFALLYSTSITFIFSLDVTFGVIGYCLTLRVLDSHVRSTDSTPLGWASAVICYAPFSSFVWKSFLGYKGEIQWHEWLELYPVLYVSWGFLILMLFSIYIWATVSFGCRFSNLTHRGIIVDGPYRFIRHPAYVAKNIGWWLMYIPFAAHAEWQSALKGCICLFLTNVIYFIRAKTEERHLMNDPAYAEYCRWVDRDGLVAQLKSFFSSAKEANATSTA